jgi:hypothetical protein
MTPSRAAIGIATVVLAFFGFWSYQDRTPPPSLTVQNPEWGHRIATAMDATVERGRIADHLVSVERYLRTRRVAGLGPEQRRARLCNLDRLHAYWQRGVFPHNHVLASRRTPVFMDEHGTLCAVGYLMARSGHGAMAARIAGTTNLARVTDLADDAEVTAWLDQEGLALEEAAMIQPSYGPIEGPRNDGNYDTATVLATGLNGGMIAWNILTLDGSPSQHLAGGFGVGLGVAQMALGGIGLALHTGPGGDHPDVEIGHAAINLAVGAAAAILGIRNLRGRSDMAEQDGVGRQEARGLQWAVSPRASRRGEVGLQVALRF